jgi:hypothetical protein
MAHDVAPCNFRWVEARADEAERALRDMRLKNMSGSFPMFCELREKLMSFELDDEDTIPIHRSMRGNPGRGPGIFQIWETRGKKSARRLEKSGDIRRRIRDAPVARLRT